MKKLIFIILFLLINVAQADNHDTANSVEDIREARTLVTATEKVSISSEIAARVEKINFLMGDAFKKGDTLISFDCKLYNAQLEVIKADYKSAQVQLKNDKELLDMRSIGELQYQLSESALKKAQAELTIAKLNVERCNIIAPYDGRVMDVYTNVFTSIEQSQPLMDIVGDGLLEAAVVVPSKWLSWLKKGHDVKIIIDETGDELNAKIISLGAAVDAASQTIELKAQFNEKYESLIPGMSGIVKF